MNGVTQEAEDENVHVSGVPTDKESVIGPARLLGEEYDPHLLAAVCVAPRTAPGTSVFSA